jgi:pyruvate dehydrogenase E2 component (dihydrolipoamide acetyltransferase)
MATPIIIPKQSDSAKSYVISEWHKKVGEKVDVGDNLFSYETNKTAFDEVSKVEGEMLAIFFEEGDEVPCLVNVCVVGQKGEDSSSFNPNK